MDHRRQELEVASVTVVLQVYYIRNRKDTSCTVREKTSESNGRRLKRKLSTSKSAQFSSVHLEAVEEERRPVGRLIVQFVIEAQVVVVGERRALHDIMSSSI